MEASNYYEDKANRQFLNETAKSPKRKPEQAENKPVKWKDTAKGVGTDLVIGVLGGGLVAAAIGKPALLVGLAVSGYGHYAQNRIISALGLGIMASGTMSALNDKSQAPVLTDRVRVFAEELKRKLFLDKLLPTKTENLNGTKLTVIKQPAEAPEALDFVPYEDPQKVRQPEITPNFNADQPLSKNDLAEDWDFNERIY